MGAPSPGPTASFAEDCLPPEPDYDSRDDLLISINAWAATRGYAFTTGKSTRAKGGRQTVTFACDRSSRPPNPSIERQRKTTTRWTGCEFSVLAKESADRQSWAVRHRPDKRFSLHNHAPSRHPSAHPAHRRLTEKDIEKLSRLSNAGIVPKDIRTYIRQNCDSLATQQDIYNGIAATKRDICEGQSSIQALASQLDQEGFWSRIQFGQGGRVTAVLFAHPESLTYLQAYPDVLLLDCTYKTNKHGMPLLDMIGVDACQRSFCIAFAFLGGETEADFVWALDRLRSLYEHHSARLPSVVLTDRCIACLNAVAISFPTSCSLLCLWLANKAVLRHCRPAFVRQDQPESTNAETIDTSESNGWSEFYQFWHSIIAATFPGDQDSGPVPGPPRDATELLVSPPPISPDLAAPPPPKYDSPEAIHKSYTAARSAWYAAQPAGSIKTNQQYRKAMRLPARYDKQSYEWCMDYKQMSRHCATTTGLRAWTKEEMMAYLDWSHAEDQRVEAQIMKEMGYNPLANTRRGVADIWRQVEKNSREQETLYSAHVEADDCIFVEP